MLAGADRGDPVADLRRSGVELFDRDGGKHFAVLVAARLEYAVVELLVRVGLVDSKRAGRELVSAGGVHINGRQVEAASATVPAEARLHGRYVVIRKGKKSYHLVTAGQDWGRAPDETA